jgi:hypothetical protein
MAGVFCSRRLENEAWYAERVWERERMLFVFIHFEAMPRECAFTHSCHDICLGTIVLHKGVEAARDRRTVNQNVIYQT